MSGMGGWGVPGIGADRTVAESELLWGADQARNGALWQSKVISGAARDAGNTPTTVLRPGLIMATLTSSGELEEWDGDASDGTQWIAGILDTELRAQDFDATNQDRVFRALVGRAPVKARKLLIQGAAFLGHADEYLARRMLRAAGFVLDDDPFGYLAGEPHYDDCADANDTILATQNGSTIFYSNAGAVAITLPTLQPGLEFTFIRTANEEMVVSSVAGDDIVVGNDLSADSITFTTGGEQIGAAVKVRSAYVGGTLKWIAELPYAPFGTGVNTLTFAIGS
jgi:hypothetical protein